MNRFEFGNCLYRTENEMLDAAVQTYLTADGLNGKDDIEDILSNHDDQALVDEIEREWRIGAEHDAIKAAFARNRASFPSWMASDEAAAEEATQMTMNARYLVDITVMQFHHDGMSPFRNRQEFKEFWTVGEMGDAIRSGEVSREEADELIQSAWEDLPLALKE